MQVYQAIHDRRSSSQLGLPAPQGEPLARVLAAAGYAPDHRLLRPWRFLVIEGEGLQALGELFAQAVTLSDPERALREAAKLRQMPLRAPMIIVAILAAQAHPTVPLWEQWLSLGAAVQNMLLAIHAEGYAAIWRTGDMAEHAHVKSALGLAPLEAIGGFIYVGTALSNKAASPTPPVYVKSWPE